MSHYRDHVVAEGVPGGKWVIRVIYGDGRNKKDLGDYVTPLQRFTSDRGAAEQFNDIKTLKRSIPPGYHYIGKRPIGHDYKEGELQYTP